MEEIMMEEIMESAPLTLLNVGWRSSVLGDRSSPKNEPFSARSGKPPVCLGRRCLSRIIWTNGGQQRSWSAEYFLHSRRQWDPQQLFQPILKRALAFCPSRLVGPG
jgi:hypothetical protein